MKNSTILILYKNIFCRFIHFNVFSLIYDNNLPKIYYNKAIIEWGLSHLTLCIFMVEMRRTLGNLKQLKQIFDWV